MDHRLLLAPWLLEVFACPACSGELGLDPRGVIRCQGCELLFPVLGGVPVLISGADRWVASHREPILAALAEHHRVDEGTLELIDIFCDAGGRAEPRRWNDDWLAEELAGDPVEAWPRIAPEQGAHGASFGAFVEAAAELAPTRLLPALAGDQLGTVIDLGTGAGALAAALAPAAERTVVADLSLRAVLTARARVIDEQPAAEVAAVVVDADRLCFVPGSVDLVVAGNLVDLLELPDDLIAAVADGLSPMGRLILTTPEPSLGDPDEPHAVDELVIGAGLDLVECRDWVPWLRPHRDREWQVFFNRVLVARRTDS